MITPQKQLYLERIRLETSYPAFRSLINLFTYLIYLVAGLTAFFGTIMGLIGIFSRGFFAGLATIIVAAVAAALYYVIGRVFKEAAPCWLISWTALPT